MEGNMNLITLLSNPVFWGALEALATLGTLILLAWQIPPIRRQMALHNVDGIKIIDEQLREEFFLRNKKIVIKKWKEQLHEFPDDIYEEIVYLFSRLNTIQILLDGYLVDKELFMELYSLGIYEIERPITNFENLTGTKIPNIRSVFPRAYKLLTECRDYSIRKTNRSFSLLSKLQK